MAKQKKKGSEKPKERKSLGRKLVNFFTTTVVGGIVVVLPITIMFLLVNFLFQFTARILEPIRNLIEIPFIRAEWLINLIALALIVVAFFFIGLIVQTSIGKQAFKMLETWLLGQLPFYNLIRETINQFFGQDHVPFSQVVAVDVFGTPTRMIGFISDDLEDGNFSVFVPTGPNPTNGFIFIVDQSQIQYLNVRPDEAMRTIIGVGSSAAELFIGKEKVLKDISQRASEGKN